MKKRSHEIFFSINYCTRYQDILYVTTTTTTTTTVIIITIIFIR
jgi:hypothetical protein